MATLREYLTPAEQERFKKLYNQGYFNQITFPQFTSRLGREFEYIDMLQKQLDQLTANVDRWDPKDVERWNYRGVIAQNKDRIAKLRAGAFDSALSGDLGGRTRRQLQDLDRAMHVDPEGQLTVPSIPGIPPIWKPESEKTVMDVAWDKYWEDQGIVRGALNVGASSLTGPIRGGQQLLSGEGLGENPLESMAEIGSILPVGRAFGRWAPPGSFVSRAVRSPLWKVPSYTTQAADILGAGEEAHLEVLAEAGLEAIGTGGDFLRHLRSRHLFQGLDPQAAEDAQTTESTVEHDDLTGSRTAPGTQGLSPDAARTAARAAADSAVESADAQVALDTATQQRQESLDQQLRREAWERILIESEEREAAAAEQSRIEQSFIDQDDAYTQQQATAEQAAADQVTAEAEQIEFTKQWLPFYADLAGGSQSEGIRLLNQEYAAGVRDPIAHRYDQIAAGLQPQMGVAPSELHREADRRLRQQVGEKWYNMYRGIDQRPTPQERAQRAAEAAEKIVEGTDGTTDDTVDGQGDEDVSPGSDSTVDGGIVDAADTQEADAATQPETENIPQAQIGTETVGYESDGVTAHNVRPVLRELDDLVPSHQLDGEKREDYPEDLQPREGRGGAISMSQVRKTAQQPNFAFLLEFFKQFRDGAPVTSRKHPRRILSGNGRTLALQLMRQEYPENWEGYQAALRAELEKVGINPAEADAMEAPVLTYEIMDDIDEVALAKDANVQATLDHTAAEQASQDTEYFDDDLMALWQPGEGSFEEVLTSEENQQFRSTLFQRIPTHLVSAFMTADNRSFSNDGIQRIQNAMIRYVFGEDVGDQLAKVLIEQGLEDVKNVEAMLRNAIASLAYAKANGQDISTDLASAIFRFIEINRNAERDAQQRKQPKDVMLYAGIEAFYQSGALIEAPTLLEKQLLYLIYAKRNAPRQLADDFQVWAQNTVSRAQASQGGMFSDPTISEAIFAGIIRDYIRETIFATRVTPEGQTTLVPPDSLPPELVNLRESMDAMSDAADKERFANDWIDAFLRMMNEGEQQSEIESTQETPDATTTESDLQPETETPPQEADETTQADEVDTSTETTAPDQTGTQTPQASSDPGSETVDVNQVVGTSRRSETPESTVSPVVQRALDTLGITATEWEQLKADGEAIAFLNNQPQETIEQLDAVADLAGDAAGEMSTDEMVDEDYDIDDEDFFSDVETGILKDITDQQRSDFDTVRRKLFLAKTIQRLEAKQARTPIETAQLRALQAPQRTDAQQRIYEQLLTAFVDQQVTRLQAKPQRSTTENRILDALEAVQAEGLPEEASELSLYADLETPDQEHSRPLAETRTMAGVQAPDTADTALDLPASVKDDKTKLSPAQQSSVKAIIAAFKRKIHTSTDTTVQGGFLLGDKPGVGKTRQALATMWHYIRQGVNRHFVLAPNEQLLNNYTTDMQAMGGPVGDISHYTSSNPQPNTPIGTATYAMLTRKPNLENFATTVGNQNAIADIVQHLTGARPTLQQTHPEHYNTLVEAFGRIGVYDAQGNTRSELVKNLVAELRRQAGRVNLKNQQHVESFRQRLTPGLADLLLAERTRTGQQEFIDAGERGSTLYTQVEQLVVFGENQITALPDPDFTEKASQFEGVIVLDEMHKAAGTSSQIGQMIATLHQLLPNAKFLYMSATPFKEIDNFWVAERLGLWGANQPFRNFAQFRTAFRRAARAVKEVIPLHLKQIGRYISRALSSKETRYTPVEVPLTETEKQQYDTAVEFVQGIRQQFESTIDAAMRTPWGAMLEAEGAFHLYRAKYMRMFYGEIQKVFLAVLDSMKAQGLEADIAAKLQAGDKIIVQLENTWEKTAERAEARGQDAAGPFDLLIDFVSNENTFPVHEHITEVRTRRDGSEYTVVIPREVYEDGQRVRSVDPSLKRQQTELLNLLQNEMQRVGQLPFAADIIHKIAADAGIASGEISGRTEIYINNTPQRMPQSPDSKIARAKTFSETTDLNLIVLGPAGLTGINLPVADSIKDEVGALYHYLLQSSWNVNTFEQGLGRGKRSNSAIDPHYMIAHQDLPGGDRVLGATLAKFAEMGALAGQADNALMQNIDKVEGETSLDDDPEADVDTDVFDAEDEQAGERSHVFGVHGQEALAQLWKDMYDAGQFEVADRLGLTRPEIAGDTGLIDPDTVPSVQQFFQRLLHQSTADQPRFYQQFEERLKRIIAYRRELGELDVGANDLNSKDGQITDRLTVYTDPDTGQTADVVRLSVKRKLPRRSWEFAQKVIRGEQGYDHHGRNFAGIYTDADGHVWAVFEAPMQEGSQETEYIRWGPRGTPVAGLHKGEHRITAAQLATDFTAVSQPNQPQLTDVSEAQQLWEAEDSAADAYVDSELFMATGLILPKWQDLSTQNRQHAVMGVIPMLDGSNLHGRVIPQSVLSEILTQIGGVDPDYFDTERRGPKGAYAQTPPENTAIDIPAIVRDIIGQQTDTRIAARLERIVEHIHKQLPLRLRGHRVRSAAEAALLGQLIRDPQVEHTWIVYRKDDRIVKIEPMSLNRKGETEAGDFAHIKRVAGEEGADSILRIHNHPSGVAKWSQADKNAAMQWHKELGTLIAEDIIVDSGTYAYRTFENGEYTWHEDTVLDPGTVEWETGAQTAATPSGEQKPTDPLYQNRPLMRGAREAATYAMGLKRRTDVAELIFIDPRTGKISDTVTDTTLRTSQNDAEIVQRLKDLIAQRPGQHVHVVMWGGGPAFTTAKVLMNANIDSMDSVWVDGTRGQGIDSISTSDQGAAEASDTITRDIGGSQQRFLPYKLKLSDPSVKSVKVVIAGDVSNLALDRRVPHLRRAALSTPDAEHVVRSGGGGTLSEDRYQQVLKAGHLLSAAQLAAQSDVAVRDVTSKIEAIDVLAGDHHYIFLSESDLYRQSYDPVYKAGSYGFVLDAEQLIKNGALVRTKDLIGDYRTLRAEVFGDAIPNFDQLSETQRKNILNAFDAMDESVEGVSEAIRLFQSRTKALQAEHQFSGEKALELLQQGKVVEILVKDKLPLTQDVVRGVVEKGSLYVQPQITSIEGLQGKQIEHDLAGQPQNEQQLLSDYTAEIQRTNPDSAVYRVHAPEDLAMEGRGRALAAEIGEKALNTFVDSNAGIMKVLKAWSPMARRWARMTKNEFVSGFGRLTELEAPEGSDAPSPADVLKEILRERQHISKLNAGRALSSLEPHLLAFNKLARKRTSLRTEAVAPKTRQSKRGKLSEKVWNFIEYNTPIENDTELLALAEGLKEAWREMLIHDTQKIVELMGELEKINETLYVTDSAGKRTEWSGESFDGFQWDAENRGYVKEGKTYTVEEAHRAANKLYMPHYFRGKSPLQEYSALQKHLDALNTLLATQNPTAEDLQRFEIEFDAGTSTYTHTPTGKTASTPYEMVRIVADYLSSEDAALQGIVNYYEDEGRVGYYGHLERTRETDDRFYTRDISLMAENRIRLWDRLAEVATIGQQHPLIGDSPRMKTLIEQVMNFDKTPREAALRKVVEALNSGQEGMFERMPQFASGVNTALDIMLHWLERDADGEKTGRYQEIDIQRMNLDDATLAELERIGLIEQSNGNYKVVGEDIDQRHATMARHIHEFYNTLAQRKNAVHSVVLGLGNWHTRDPLEMESTEFWKKINDTITVLTLNHGVAIQNLLEIPLISMLTGANPLFKGLRNMSNTEYRGQMQQLARGLSHARKFMADTTLADKYLGSRWTFFSKSDEFSRAAGLGIGLENAKAKITQYAEATDTKKKAAIGRDMDSVRLNKDVVGNIPADQLASVLEAAEQLILNNEVDTVFSSEQGGELTHAERLAGTILRSMFYISDEAFKQYDATSLPKFMMSRNPLIRVFMKYKSWMLQQNRLVYNQLRRAYRETKKGNLKPLSDFVAASAMMGLGTGGLLWLYSALQGDDDDKTALDRMFKGLAAAQSFGIASVMFELAMYAEGNWYQMSNLLAKQAAGPTFSVAAQMVGPVLTGDFGRAGEEAIRRLPIVSFSRRVGGWRLLEEATGTGEEE